MNSPSPTETRAFCRTPTRASFSLLLGTLLGGCKEAGPKADAISTAATTSSVATLGTSTSTTAAASAAPTPASEPAAAARGPFNVVVLTVDSLRADMPWTGYPRAIAPNLTALAKTAVVYPNAYSVSSYTAKSVGAMLSGVYPSSLYRSGWFFTGYSDDNLFFPELLQQRGVHTLSAHAHLYFDRGKNLNQGFDVWELVKGITFDAQTDKHVTSDKLVDLGISLIKDAASTSKPFFAWFHFMDPHDQYIKHKESPDFGNTNRDRFDSEVYFADLHIGRLLDFVRQQPWGQKTAFILSADHGEAFGEHGVYKHAFDVWEVLTRVPLVISVPGAKPQVIEQRRSQIDLAPTILELQGVPAPNGTFAGKSLVPEIFGAPAQSHEPIVLDLPEDSHNPPRRAVIHDDYKLTVSGKGLNYQLYNLKLDPEEKTELSKKEPAKLEEMKLLFEKTWSQIPQVEPFGGMKLKSGRLANGPMNRAQDPGKGQAKPSKP